MKRWNEMLTLFIALSILASCQNSGRKKMDDDTMGNVPGIEKRTFGEMPNGEEIYEYTLRNSNKIEISIITYGGIIRTLSLPDKNGNFEDVVLGYDNLDEYLDNNPYFGSIIGRYGNRIAKGKFSVDGTEYTLATNNLGNHLHGGEAGFDKVVWKAEEIQGEEDVSLKLTYLSPDMEEGYPGNLNVEVTYKLTNNNELVIDYKAVTDKKTIVNLTNHAYFNLSAKEQSIVDHQLQINASNYLPVDETLIPTEISSVHGTPFDFKKMKVIGADINNENLQLKYGGGFDHCWVLNESEDRLSLAASLLEPYSGRRVDVYTTEPGIQFYSGNFLDGSITGKKGSIYKKRYGLCLETQHYPDSPNRPDFPSTELKPGEIYKSTTVYKFSAD